MLKSSFTVITVKLYGINIFTYRYLISKVTKVLFAIVLCEPNKVDQNEVDYI